KIVLPDGGAGPVAFSPDGKSFAVATGEPDRRIRVWDVSSEKEAASIQGYRGEVRSLAFSPDGTRLITGMRDTSVLVWGLKSRRTRGDSAMKSLALTLPLVALAAAAVPGDPAELLPPVPIQVAGAPLDVAREGHAAPFVGDFFEDGTLALLVGQYDS